MPEVRIPVVWRESCVVCWIVGAYRVAEELIGERDECYKQAMRRHFGGVARE